MLVIILFGLSRFIHNPWILKIISLAGVIILFYFGLKILFALPHISLGLENGGAGPKNLILTGITMSIANPFWTIWWLTIGLGLLLAAKNQGLLAVGIFFLGHILADLSWYSLVSVTVSKTKRFISERIYKGMLASCGLWLWPWLWLSEAKPLPSGL